jgi:CHAD domain-containing protein
MIEEPTAPQPIIYLLPDNFDLQGLKRQLAESNTLLAAQERTVEQTYFDSFDWRIWQADGLLAQERGDVPRLCWIERKSGACRICERVEATPGFSRDLPAGPLRERLAQVLEMRALLPLVRVTQRLHTLRILDDEEKTVVRVVLQENRYASLDGRLSGALEERVVLQPLKGYAKPFAALQNQLEAWHLIVAERSLCEQALAAIARKPGDYSSKLNYILDPDARADAAAKKILLGLLATLEANVEGAKANLDSEFLHDLRVATRRTRSAMSQIKGVFDTQLLAPFKKGFAWLGKATSLSRDMDVYLLQFPEFQASLPTDIRADLEPFHDFLLRHQAQAQRELVKKLNSPHFRKLVKSWRDWLNRPLPEKPKAPNAGLAIAQLADQRIRKLYSKVLQRGEAIRLDSPPERLHDLRKECKKLRYLMEFFQSLYPKPEIRRLIKEVKMLLDNLGRFQDLHVQAESLEAFGRQMMKEGAPANALMAMGILVGKLLEQQAEARREFNDLFVGFNSAANRRAFHKLFGR